MPLAFSNLALPAFDPLTVLPDAPVMVVRAIS
jgi:hypothetical protein